MNDELVKCPGCELELPAGDLQAQKRHMEEAHPEIVRGRLEDAGFEQREDGSWHDTLLDPDFNKRFAPYDEFNAALDRAPALPAGGAWSGSGAATTPALRPPVLPHWRHLRILAAWGVDVVALTFPA